jgi:hypothetical protein
MLAGSSSSIHGVVHEQLIDNGGQLLVGDKGDDHLLGLRFQVGENLRRGLFGHGAEHHSHVLGVQRLDPLGHVHRIEHIHHAPQGGKLLLLQQAHEQIRIKIVRHFPSS